MPAIAPGSSTSGQGPITNADWLFEVVFDYGEHDHADPKPSRAGEALACRDDPFSTYRSPASRSAPTASASAC
jgi:hypothetical protein